MTDRTSDDHPTSVGGAKWCPAHRRFECTAQRKHGAGDCHSIAVEGTSKCRMHAGVSLEVLKAKGQATITAFNAIGAPPSMQPGQVVLAALHMSWLRAHLYAALLEDQVREAREASAVSSADFTDGAADLEPSADGVAGLIGHTYAADKMAGIFASGEAVRALVQLEAQERDRAVRYAKTAHDMGIAEREVRLAEQQGQLLANVIRNVLSDLDLSPEQQGRVPAVVQRHLLDAAQLEAGGAA